MSKVLNVERRSIEFVPIAERHGRVRSLFTLWFGANLQVTAIAAGGISVAVGLSLPWALIASVLGTLIGAIFMALHSAQGPILGIPQMIQSRAQFGYLGAVLPLVLVILMYIGYFATTGVQGGAAFTSLTGVPIDWSIVLLIAVTTVLTIFGYRLMHASEKWLSVISGLTFLYLTYELIAGNDFGRLWHLGGFSWGPFLLATAVAATFQLTYAPYVADYSRYLPEGTSVRKSFWYTYLGTVIASSWMFAFGAMATALSADAFEGGSVDFIVEQAPAAHWLFYLVIIAGVVAVNALNLYGLFMSTTTVIGSLSRLRMTGFSRAALIVALAAVTAAIAVAGRANFLTNFTNFILLLAYFLIPWTSINLADFYLIRKERYNIDDMYRRDGEYGGVDWRAMLAYLIGVAVEIPFVATDFYTGPMVAPLGGADISWILGIFVSGGAYVAVMRARPVRAKYPPSATGRMTGAATAQDEEPAAT